MTKNKENSCGYITIETILSLAFFTLAIMFVYFQIKVVIAENILQNAVNNMSKEVSSYVYILDKLGLVLDHTDDENKDINALIGDVMGEDGAINNVIGFTDSLLGGGGTNSDDMAAAIGEFVEALKEEKEQLVNDINNLDKEDLKNAAITAGEDVVKGFANIVLASYYDSRLDRYLPMSREDFCRHFNIDIPEDGKAFSFDASRVFPTSENNSIMVAVSYKTTSPIKFINLKRKICKYAYSGAWVSSSTNQLKKGG